LADLALPGSVVADIGTDHALLPIYLIKQGLAAKVIAVENRATTYKQARRSLEIHNCTPWVDLRSGCGLKPIEQEDGVEIVYIAGLGGRSICQILLASRDKWSWFQRLILQPMRESSLLRRWLLAYGMAITSEKLVQEVNHIYEIIITRRGRQEIADPVLFELGPCLFRDRDPLLGLFIRQKIERCRAISLALRDSVRPKSKSKQAYYQELEIRLTEVLNIVGDSGNHSRLS